METLEQFRETFFLECDELLSKLESHLSALEKDGSNVEEVDAAFRALHSIKGGAGMFGYARLVGFAHLFESALDLMRRGTLSADGSVVGRTLLACDVLAELVNSFRRGEPLAPGFEAGMASDLTALVSEACGGASSLDTDLGALSREQGALEPTPASAGVFRIVFRPHPGLLKRGIDPLRIVRELKALGTVTVTADTSRLPPIDALDTSTLFLSWVLEIETTRSWDDVMDVFEFVKGSSDLEFMVVRAHQEAEQPLERVKAVPPLSDAPRGAEGAMSAPQQRGEGNAAARAGPRAKTTQSQNQRASSIRVELDRVDRLVNLVGEIAISQAMVLQQIDQALIDENPKLFRELTQLLQHTRTLQDSVMAIRAQPVRSIFARMPRVVRELEQQTGKKVAIEMSGQETEIDKTIIEELSDPLIHIIRNSIDHGIELPEERLAAGKPATGTVTLSATHRGGRIIVQVSDDGRGIDRMRVREQAVRQKLVPVNAELSDEEILGLILMPGFSTAESISDLSGRGVGMDVVQRNIQRLGGRILLRSEPGKGTTTTITLPLTLAVMDGMVVRCGRESYLLPLSNVVECQVVPRRDLRSIPGSGQVINVRGRQTRIVALEEVVGIETGAFPRGDRLSVVLVEAEGGMVSGLAVDEIIGQQQVVIKSVRENFGEVPGIAGATILGDGAVAFILDVTAICELSAHREQASFWQRIIQHETGARVA